MGILSTLVFDISELAVAVLGGCVYILVRVLTKPGSEVCVAEKLAVDDDGDVKGLGRRVQPDRKISIASGAEVSLRDYTKPLYDIFTSIMVHFSVGCATAKRASGFRIGGAPVLAVTGAAGVCCFAPPAMSELALAFAG